MSTTWIVVADRSRCSMYRRVHGTELEPVEQLSHPTGRQNDAAMSVSRPDVAHGHEADVFAKEIATHLQHARTANRFDAIVLVAEAHFLGLLHEALDPATRKLVGGEVRKHLTSAPLDEIARQVPALLS